MAARRLLTVVPALHAGVHTDGETALEVLAAAGTSTAEFRTMMRCLALLTFVLAACGSNGSTQPDASGTGDAGDAALPSGDAAVDSPMPYTGPRAKSLAAYSTGACALTESDVLRCWGKRRATPSTIQEPSTFKRVALATVTECAIRSDDTLWCWTYVAPTPTQIAGSYSDIAVGDFHRCAITTGGALVCWGNNSNGELGLGDTNPRTTPTQVGSATNWVDVEASDRHTCAIDSGGVLYCWGAAPGLGNDAPLSSTTPMVMNDGMTFKGLAVSSFVTAAVRSDGALFRGTGSTLEQVGTATSWTTIRESQHPARAHRCGFQGTTLFCWGSNDRGQVGDPTATPDAIAAPLQIGAAGEYIDVAVGVAFSCAIRSDDGSVRCWGSGAEGQLGDGRAIAPRATPSLVGTAGEWATLYASHERTCAVRKNNTPACWGDRFNSGLFPHDRQRPDSVAGEPAINSNVAELAASVTHFCVKRPAGGLTCWGQNISGQVGTGQTSPTAPATDVALTIKAVSLGNGFTCAIGTNDRLYCWGNAAANRLGFPSATNVPTPTLVGTDTWKALVANTSSSCAIRMDGTLHCWGTGYTGIEQVSTATTWTALAPSSLDGTFAGISGGVLHRWDSSEAATRLPVAVASTSNWSAVAGNFSHHCGVRTDGTMQCLGQNFSGEIGDATTSNPAVLVDVPGISDWTAVVTGFHHTCGLRADGSLYCFGENFAGAIGDGTSWSLPPVIVQL